jgi:hypothetical protein
MRESGITLVVVEQNLPFARACTDRLHARAAGTVRFSGTWREFAVGGDVEARNCTDYCTVMYSNLHDRYRYDDDRGARRAPAGT